MSSTSLALAISRVREIDEEIKQISVEIVLLQKKTAGVDSIEQFLIVEASYEALSSKLDIMSRQRTNTMSLIQRLSANEANLNYVGDNTGNFKSNLI